MPKVPAQRPRLVVWAVVLAVGGSCSISGPAAQAMVQRFRALLSGSAWCESKHVWDIVAGGISGIVHT